MGKMLLTSFNNGEVSPHIDGRSDVAKYASSCRLLKNMLPKVYGDVERRPGTEFIAEAKVNTTGVRLIPFIFSAVISYMCEFGNLYIRFYFGGAPLLQSDSSPVEVASPYVQSDLAALQLRQIGDTMWIVHPDYAPRKLTRTSATAFSLDTIAFKSGPFLLRNDLDEGSEFDGVTLECDATAKDATGTLTASDDLFETGHVGSIWQVVQDRTTNTVSTNATNISDELDVKGTFTFKTEGSWLGTVKLERSIDQGDTWDAFRIYVNDVARTNYSLSSTEDEANILYQVNCEGVSGAYEVRGVLAVDSSIWEGIVRFDAYLTSTTATVTILTKLITADETTLRWAEGAWSGVRGYPTGVGFFEDRIIYGGTTNQPQKLWFSKTDDYENFQEGTNDAESFAISMAATNDIRWINSLETLIVGTSGDEWRIGSDRLEAPITPTNFSIRQQTTYGSKAIQAVKSGTVVLFVDYVGRRIREFTYNADQQTHVAPDLTELAEHITATGITGIAYQKNPDSILWCVLTDGSLVSMTYQRSQNVVAWADHPMQSGVKVESVAVMPGPTEDEVWILAVRSIGGAAKRYIERMKTRVFATQADAFFVDSGLLYDGSETATFSGLDHLEGETVKILGDGAVFTPQVVTNGSVTLDTAVSKAVVGLAYRYILKPMRIDLSTRGGSSKGSFKKIAEMYISFLDTLNAQYGKSVDDLFDIPWRSEEEYTTPPDLFTGDKKVVLPAGYDPEDPIVISGDDPLPCTVRALAVDIQVSGG